jgi:hypothetical protein
MSSLGLTECRPAPSPVQFVKEDPLGIRMVCGDSTYDMSTHGDKDKSRDTARAPRKTLGEQASVITSTHDRALALKRITIAAHISLSRELVLNMVYLLCQCTIPAALSHGLRTLGLGDAKILVSLMRLVAAGRVCVSSSGKGERDENSGAKSSRSLKALSKAVCALATDDQTSAKLLLNLCVRDLMTSATGAYSTESNVYCTCITI